MDSHSKSGPASSLSIADLQDMVNQVHLPSSSASNTALSTTSGTSPTWLLDSAYCNHMTSSPNVVPSHTSTSLLIVSVARKWPLFQMDVKNAFLNGELSEEVYMKLLTLRGSLTEYFDYGEHFMGLNKLLEHGLQSSVLLSLSMIFQAVLLI